MERKQELVEAIESVYNNQKERYNDQLCQLYELSFMYRKLTGINPLSGKVMSEKDLDLRSVSEREYQFITQATRDAYSFPATVFEQSLLQCIDSQTGTVNSVQLGRKLMRLIKETRSVGERYYLIEICSQIRNKLVLDYLYGSGLQVFLYRYLDENGDIVTNYDYILHLLNLLVTIPLPERIDLECIHLDYYLHCGDPDIEDLALRVKDRWNHYNVSSNKEINTSKIIYQIQSMDEPQY